MQLKDVLSGVEIKKCSFNLNIEISNIQMDSRKIQKNDIFIAIKGENYNGNDFIKESMTKGAVCVISEDESDYDFVIVVENVRFAMSQMYKNYYNNPSENMKIICITGTNGKTSTAMFLYSILKSAKKSVGLISTIKCLINDSKYDIKGGADTINYGASMTTPDPGVLYETLFQMKKSGVEYVVMEASSHALELQKLDGLNIEIGVFTNLSKEHLDFHKNEQSYFEAKQRLFNMCECKIINIDDKYGEKLSISYPESYTISKLKNANLRIKRIKISNTGSTFCCVLKENKIKIKTSILGDFTTYNIALAVMASKLLRIKSKYIKKGIKKCRLIEGRIEKISCNIYIDYAHTPEAMERVLLYFKKIFPNKKIKVLFGCGGDRDKTKRKEMGRIASNLANSIIVTSDNSRFEDPIKIAENIKEGLNSSIDYCIMLDRREAIVYAINNLKKNEILLLLGKGHENYEILNGSKNFFSEKEIIIEALKNGKNT